MGGRKMNYLGGFPTPAKPVSRPPRAGCFSQGGAQFGGWFGGGATSVRGAGVQGVFPLAGLERGQRFSMLNLPPTAGLSCPGPHNPTEGGGWGGGGGDTPPPKHAKKTGGKKKGAPPRRLILVSKLVFFPPGRGGLLGGPKQKRARGGERWGGGGGEKPWVGGGGAGPTRGPPKPIFPFFQIFGMFFGLGWGGWNRGRPTARAKAGVGGGPPGGTPSKRRGGGLCLWAAPLEGVIVPRFSGGSGGAKNFSKNGCFFKGGHNGARKRPQFFPLSRALRGSNSSWGGGWGLTGF